MGITRFDLPETLEDWLVVSWAVLLPFVTALAWKLGRPGASPLSKPPGQSGRRSVAVLPFVNMSGDPKDDYLGDGLSEEVINALVKVPDLQVASRTSTFTYKKSTKDIRAIGKELNVGAVLEVRDRQG